MFTYTTDSDLPSELNLETEKPMGLYPYPLKDFAIIRKNGVHSFYMDEEFGMAGMRFLFCRVMRGEGGKRDFRLYKYDRTRMVWTMVSNKVEVKV